MSRRLTEEDKEIRMHYQSDQQQQMRQDRSRGVRSHSANHKLSIIKCDVDGSDLIDWSLAIQKRCALVVEARKYDASDKIKE